MSAKGAVVLMGSGELTGTMVEVHKEMLAAVGPSARAVFVDTPAGFQLNADQISARAVDYFLNKVGHPMSVASIRSKSDTPDLHALITLKQADFVLIGPGSPTYAVRQWKDTPVPETLAQRVEAGGCLVAASAAALTVGRFTLPVYEIYKVGEEPRWVEGLDLLGRFGLNLVVVPHWNNAEGGTHDTRFCFMGEPRFRLLESMLPEGTAILGLDEHTACILDLSRNEARIRGIGSVTLRRRGSEQVLRKGAPIPLEVLRGRGIAHAPPAESPPGAGPCPVSGRQGASFWEDVRALEGRFHDSLDAGDPASMTAAILELDRLIWRASQDLEHEEAVSQAREVFRDWIVLAGTSLSAARRDTSGCLAPIVEEMLALRRRFRDEKQWEAADAIRDGLKRANVAVEDTPEGSRWKVLEPGERGEEEVPRQQGGVRPA
jgi:cyanophycinase-like exopeptidase